MNNETDISPLRLASVGTWNGASDGDQPFPAATLNHGSREIAALFPAGRFFSFPVRIRVQLAPEARIDEPFADSNGESPYSTAKRLVPELGRVVCALIENATCRDMGSPIPEIFLFGEVMVDFRKMELRRNSVRIDATSQEFKTLQYFVTHPEAVISREELLNNVWGFHRYPTTRTVDNRIMQLRKKLERDPACPKHLLTVHGAGYKFVP